MATIGYARVSTNDQNLTSQRDALRAAGAHRVFEEKISGSAASRRKRKELDRAIAALNHGDILLVTRLDRLARSSLDLLNIIDQVTTAGCKFKSLADPWCDTSTAHGELMLQILAALAQFERSLILARTGAGRAHARKHGTKSGRPFGAPPKLSEDQRQDAMQALAGGALIVDVAAKYRVSTRTILRLKNTMKKAPPEGDADSMQEPCEQLSGATMQQSPVAGQPAREPSDADSGELSVPIYQPFFVPPPSP